MVRVKHVRPTWAWRPATARSDLCTGEVIKTVPEAQIVETLIEEAMRLAAEMGEQDPGATPSGSPIVTVS